MKKQEIALEKAEELLRAFMEISSKEMHPLDLDLFDNNLQAIKNILYAQLYKNQKPLVATITCKDLLSILDDVKHRKW